MLEAIQDRIGEKRAPLFQPINFKNKKNNCDLVTRVSRRLMQITALFSESNSPYNISFPLFGRVD